MILTKLSQTYNQEITLRVELSNLDDEVVILDDTTRAKVVINAKGFNLLPYFFNASKSLKIDAQKDAQKTAKNFIYILRNNRYQIKKIFGNSIEISEVKPDTIFYNYDLLASKKVPVKFISEIDYALGYDVIDKVKLEFDSVKIVGSKKQIDTIQFLNTEVLELKGVNSDISEIVKLKNDVEALDIIPNQLEVKGNVRRFTEGQFSIPVELINKPAEKTINYFPKDVDLIFYVDIESFKNVKKEDFKVVCDFNRFNYQEQRSLELQITKKPALVKSARLLQNKIEFIISE
ncbi:CdaR family protein [Winogradskyella wandonensis]|uniref:CdaR family protein n=1 Tax=Winogradskyella wandonensis TaxID=1442586 RepID=UPI0010495019|nr:YbbR-like domain-containing protein [Winogradskyella wandonensis]